MAKKSTKAKQPPEKTETTSKHVTLQDRLKNVPEDKQKCRLVQMDGFVQYFFDAAQIYGSTADLDEIKFLEAAEIKPKGK